MGGFDVFILYEGVGLSRNKTLGIATVETARDERANMIAQAIKESELRKIEEITTGMECDKNFECYKSGFTKICRTKLVGNDTFLKCLDENACDCKFSLPGDGENFCLCSLRLYIAKRWRR